MGVAIMQNSVIRNRRSPDALRRGNRRLIAKHQASQAHAFPEARRRRASPGPRIDVQAPEGPIYHAAERSRSRAF